MEQVSYQPRFLEGVEHFNSRSFFDAHEVWEDVWNAEKGSARDFYKGLIQVAVSLLHFGRGNTRGARKLYSSSQRYLREYGSHFRGVDIDKLLSDMDHCYAELVSCEDETPRVKVVNERLPQIHLDPPAVAGN